MKPQRIFAIYAILFVLALTGCSGGGGSGNIVATSQTPAPTPASSVVADNPVPGVTPFISFVNVHWTGPARVKEVAYTIETKPGHISKPVTASYSFDYLLRRGYASASSQTLTLPIFGLYTGYRNTVDIRVVFEDNASLALPIQITAAAPSGYARTIYSKPKILKARTPDSSLGFDYFYMDSLLGTPVVVDTDGEVRWVGAGTMDSQSTLFVDNGFVIGSTTAPKIYRFELDGTTSVAPLVPNDPTIQYIAFHHSIDPGNVGLFVDVNARINGQNYLESLLAETDSSGKVIANWDFAKILTQYMQSQGDDPALFVRPANDWFHLNSAIYDPKDDSIIASSRENFVIKIDYKTGNVIWIFGDPTKYWYAFPSLRAKSLTLADNGFYPVGQHALSFTPEGLLLLFNNGYASADPPPGASAGEARSFSSVSAYSIDAVGKTASEVWRFDYNQSIFTGVCGSAYQATDSSTLISYANVYVNNLNYARLVGLDSAHQVVIDFQYVNQFVCSTSWAAKPLPFEALSFK